MLLFSLHFQNVDIIVFPEDGIYGFIRERNHLRHYLEDIPDPKIVHWVPCDEQTRFPQPLDVIVFLSCLAKKSSLYLVANYGDAKACIQDDPNCPTNGQYQYNTDLAFDRSGRLIAKYHKLNLYYENQFDEPIVPEYVYFDTDFGRFGMFTCFDILFHEPMIPLLTKYNITNIAFPTAWMDVMPYYSAIGYHSSVAMAYGVNLLAANIHLPLFRFQGSGIYTPNGANMFYYDKISFLGKLLISDVDIVQRGYTINEDLIFQDSSHSLRNQRKMATSFMSVIFKDWYHTIPLSGPSAVLKVCQRELCCTLEYETNGLNDLYGLGVFDGKHKEEGEYYLQVCVLFKCESSDITTCGKTTFEANTTFKSLRMSGTFGTPFVTPQIILTDNGSLRLPGKGLMAFENGQLRGHDTSYPLLSATLFGRFYERD